MEHCEMCLFVYPTGLLLPIKFPHEDIPSQNVCGICALAIRNEYLGAKNKTLGKKSQEDLRKAAMAWKKIANKKTNK